MKFNHLNWGHPISSHGQPECVFFFNSYIFVNRFHEQVGGLELIVSILGWWSSRFKFLRLQKNHRSIAGIIMDNIMEITEIFIQSYPSMIPMDNMNGTYYGYPFWSNKISEAEEIMDMTRAPRRQRHVIPWYQASLTFSTLEGAESDREESYTSYTHKSNLCSLRMMKRRILNWYVWLVIPKIKSVCAEGLTTTVTGAFSASDVPVVLLLDHSFVPLDSLDVNNFRGCVSQLWYLCICCNLFRGW